MNTRASIHNLFDIKTLLIGLVCVGAFYLSLYAYVVLNDGKVRSALEAELAAQITALSPLESPKAPAQEHAALAKAHPDIKPPAPAPTLAPAAVAKTAPLFHDDLLEDAPEGKLPIIRSSDNLSSYHAYKSKGDFAKTDLPRIAFIISGFGLSQKLSETAMDTLPAQVSFVLSPYAAHADEWAKRLRQKGHEVFLELPIAKSASDLGALQLNADYGLPRNQENMRRTMASAQGYIGLAAQSDLLINNDSDTAKALLGEIFERGLALLELNPAASKDGAGISLTHNSPYIRADYALSPADGMNAFVTIENILKIKGHAVVVVPAYAGSLKNLSAWIMKVAAAQYALVPASSIYDSQFSQPPQTPQDLSTADKISPPDPHTTNTITDTTAKPQGHDTEHPPHLPHH